MQNNIDFNFLNQHWAVLFNFLPSTKLLELFDHGPSHCQPGTGEAWTVLFAFYFYLSSAKKETFISDCWLTSDAPSWLISHVDVVIVASHQDKHRPGPRLIEPIYFSTHCLVKYLSKKSFIFFVSHHSSAPSSCSGSMWNSEHFCASWLPWDLPDLNSFLFAFMALGWRSH